MRIKLLNQLRTYDDSVRYEFEEDMITVHMTLEDNKTVTDTFDFKGLSDGSLPMYLLGKEGEFVDTIQTDLPLNPIHSAEKIDGVLKVELLHWVDELKELESDWLSVEEYLEITKAKEESDSDG